MPASTREAPPSGLKAERPPQTGAPQKPQVTQTKQAIQETRATPVAQTAQAAPVPVTGRSLSIGVSDDEYARRLQQEFDNEAREKAARTRFQCPLCLEDGTFDDSVELDCSHRLCRDCFVSYLEVKIKEKCVAGSEMACPMPGCGCEVTDLQVQGAVQGTPMWDRFLATRAELWRPSAPEDGQLCECPTPDCCRFLAPKTLNEVVCPQCSLRFCPKCRANHAGKTCEQFRQESDPADSEFDKFVQQQCWQRCPSCRAPCERSYGCNYMTCYSEVCRGKTNFCYLCGKELSMVEHYTHYPAGLFENMCTEVDRRNEEGLSQARFFNPEHGNWFSSMVQGLKGWAFGTEEQPQGQQQQLPPAEQRPQLQG